MITDEQLSITCKAFYGKYIQPDCCCDEELQVIRRTLEAYEQSKWVKFDGYDKSTYPPFDVRVLVKLKGDFGVGMRIDFMTHIFEWYNAIRLSYVTHWRYLPEFKE